MRLNLVMVRKKPWQVSLAFLFFVVTFSAILFGWIRPDAHCAHSSPTPSDRHILKLANDFWRTVVPGTCVIGLQWGDEAKGKIVDLLTAARIVVRYQGGATPGTPSSRAARPTSSPRAQRHLPPDVRSASSPAAWCSIRRACWRRSTALDCAGVAGRPEPDDQRPGPCHLSLARRGRPAAGRRPPAARASARRCAASGRAIATRSAARSPSGWATCIAPDFASRVEQIVAGEEPDARRPSAAEHRGRSTPQAIFAEYSGYAERLQPHVGRHDGLPARRGRGRQADAVRRGPRLAARHRPRHLPVRHQQQQFGRRRLGRLGRAGPVHHQGDRHRQGVHARASAAGRSPPSRTTRPASTSATAATNTAPSPAARAAAAGSTPWPSATRRGSAASTACPSCCWTC